MDTISDRYGQASGGPKYRLLAGALRDAIAAGEVAIGEKLPPVRDLAWKLSITPGTVARAYTLLTDERILTAEVGRGTFVAPPQQNRDILGEQKSVQNLTDDLGSVSLFSTKLPDLGQGDLVRSCLKQIAEDPGLDVMNYPSRDSAAPARRAILRWLAGAVVGPVHPNDLVLSHGGQNAVMLVMQAVLKGNRPTLLVEELCYPGFRRAAQLMRAEVIAVPMDGQGVDPDALERLARAHDAQLFCTSAEVHNPTGIYTPMERREEIASVVRRTGLHLLEDDCYRLDASRAPAYRALLPDQAWYVSSISKSLTPALRVGFAIAPQGFQAQLRRVAEYGFFGLSRPLAELTARLLGQEETYIVMAKMRAELLRYIRAAVNGLGGYDITWSPSVPFIWLRLPEGWRASAFVQAAEAEGVQLRAAEEFAMRDGTAPHAVRLGINAQISLQRFEEAIGCLRALLDNPSERMAV